MRKKSKEIVGEGITSHDTQSRSRKHMKTNLWIKWEKKPWVKAERGRRQRWKT